MGGYSYDRAVYSSGVSSSTGTSWNDSGFTPSTSYPSYQSSYDRKCGSSFSYSPQAKAQMNNSIVNESLFPRDRTLTCAAKAGIVIVLDHTGSMGDAARTIFDKLPMFYGQIEKKGYLEDFAISFAGVGDVNSDRAPLQVCDFAKGLELDEWLKKIYLEGNGGGQARESYELMALYYLRHAQFTHPNADKPFMFIIGDESFYDKIYDPDVRVHLGIDTEVETASKKVFEDLRRKYRVFMLHIPYDCRKDPSDSAGETVISQQPWLEREIVRQWQEIFQEDFIVIKEPKAIVDVILGCIALEGERRTLTQYLQDMKGRGQTAARIIHVEESLNEKSNALAIRKSAEALARRSERGGASIRL